MRALVSTCYLHYNVQLLEKIARAFNRRFYNEAAGYYGMGSQACQAIPLVLGLVPSDRISPAVRQLMRDIEVENGTYLSTGNLATRYVLEVLSDYGHVDLAWALVIQRSYPTWGFMLNHGATTIWERW